jgi:hypothetical protein
LFCQFLPFYCSSRNLDENKMFWEVNKLYFPPLAFLFIVQIYTEYAYILYISVHIHVRVSAMTNCGGLHCTLNMQKTQDCSVLHFSHPCVVGVYKS